MHRTRVTAAVAALSILCGTAPASAQEWEGASPSELRDAVELFSADRAALSGRYGSYPPLHQAAYMLGALQFRALHQELVGSGRMTDREFHDAILRGGPHARRKGSTPTGRHHPHEGLRAAMEVLIDWTGHRACPG